MKFNPTLQKEMEWKKGIKKNNDYPETRCWAVSTCVHQGISEKKCDKLREMKEEIRKLLLEVTSSSKKKKTTKVTLIILKLALEPLFLFALEFFRMTG